ncbi:hypothetical protein ACCO45_013524 [Purpureocillium lilacinum]|uniref:Uncharacterized protein n=1 Tax=Purpureocillium lilacinum TaxID=33203 RepID=A0ACC4D6V0_PURLI
MKDAQAWFNKHPAPNRSSAEDLAKVVGLATAVYDELWSDTDERRLLQMYRASGTDREVQSISTTHTRLLEAVEDDVLGDAMQPARHSRPSIRHGVPVQLAEPGGAVASVQSPMVKGLFGQAR